MTAATPLPWNEKTAPNRVRPRECVGNARDALDRAYARTDRAAVPLLIEALDWLRRGLEQMTPDDKIGGALSDPTSGQGANSRAGLSDYCACSHPKAAHADCGAGPCRSSVSLTLWHDGDDRKTVACRCRSYFKPIETVEVPDA